MNESKNHISAYVHIYKLNNHLGAEGVLKLFAMFILKPYAKIISNAKNICKQFGTIILNSPL